MSSRLVIVHERFTELGGSEKVVGHLASLAEDTRVWAPVVDRRFLPAGLDHVDVASSGLQRLYRADGRYAHLLPLLPAAMAAADLSAADLVIVSHHAFANRVRVPPGVPLVSYTHSPARWMWDRTKLSGEPSGRLGAAALRSFAAAARRGDRAAAQRADLIIANSSTVAGRIRNWWGRHAMVVHPPVSVDYFTPAPVEREDFLLIAGRLVPYKRVDVAIAAANELGRRLIVAGDGRSRPALERLAGPTVEFMGSVSDAELRQLFRTCQALLFPAEEDFGIVPVEAQACGSPVIATMAGGAAETIVDGVTGILAPTGDRSPVDAMVAAIERFDDARFDPIAIRQHAERFSTDRFHHEMVELLARTFPDRPLAPTGFPPTRLHPPGFRPTGSTTDPIGA